MRQIFEKFKTIARHPFSKDVAILQGGTLINTGLAVATSLIFARLLGPEGYGFYALVFALAGLVNIFQEFGLGQAAINLLARAYAQKDHIATKDLLAQFTKLVIIVFFIFGILGAFAAPFIGKWVYQDLELGKLAGIVVLTTALTYGFPLATITLQVIRKITTLTILESVQKIFNTGLPILLIFAGLGVSGIVYGQFLAMVVMSIVGIMIYQSISDSQSFFPKLKYFFWQKIEYTKLWQFFRFGLAIAISKNLVKLATTIPILFVGYFLPTNSGLGYYKVALAYMALPVTLLGPVSRLLNVQFPRTEMGGTDKLLRRFFQVSMLSFMLTATILLPLLFVGPFLVKLFYGTDFAPAIPMLYPLAFYPLFVGVGVGLGPLFRTMNRMRVAITINIISVILMIPTAYYLISTMAIRGLIITVLIFSFLPNLLSFFYFINLYYKFRNGKAI